MNATTAPAPARAATPAPAAVGHKDALREKHAHAGVAMAVATFAMAAASGLQALLYLSSFGVGQRTDGFFAAFALYSTFGIFSQSIRVTSAPLLVGDRARMTAVQLGGALVVIALPVAVATWPLAALSAKGLAPGLSAGAQAVTAHALAILGGAMILQLWAAGAATLLAVRNRFDRVAMAYISGAFVGTIVYLAVSGSAGELSLGWSMLAMAAVTCAVMVSGVWTSGGLDGARRGLRPRALTRCVGLVLGSTLVYLAFNALFLVTVAFASRFDPGDATVVSYAYLFASYLVAGTGFALGLSRIADMRRGALADWREVIADTVPAGFRYSMMICAPAIAALVAAGAPLIGAIFPDSLDATQVGQLRVFGALLGAWTIAALLVTLLLPAMFALGRAKLVNLLALPLVALHLAATAIGGALFGVDGVVCGLCVAPSCFAVVLLLVGARGSAGPLARELTRDGLRFCLLAVGCFGAGVAVGAVASGVVGALIALAIGSILYALVTSRLAARQVRLLMTAVRPSSA